ncbi:MAG: ABC transporter permease subunit [Planctomycetes bacterium]|nr:ABC transporter permease subunit [Planctomycetota bacterium]
MPKKDSGLQESKTKEEKKLIAGASLWSEAWRRLRKNKVAIICIVLIMIIFSACTIYAIPHLSSLSKKGAFELIVTDVKKGSIAEEAGIKTGDIILKYDNVDVIGYRVTNILLDKIILGNIKNKEKNLPLQNEVKILLNRKIPKTQTNPIIVVAQNNDVNNTKYKQITLIAKVGKLGIKTNEPLVFFQDFSQTTQIIEATNQPPASDHWFGTDNTGRDLFARTLFGGFISFIIGMLATLVASFIGVIYGSIAGYFGGRVDGIMRRIVDILYGLPFLMIIILIKVIADDFKKNEQGGEIFSNVISVILIAIIMILLLWLMFALLARLNINDKQGKSIVPKGVLVVVFLFLISFIVYEIVQTWLMLAAPEVNYFEAIAPLALLLFITFLFIWFLTSLGKRLDSQTKSSTFLFPGGVLMFFFIYMGVYGIFNVSQMWVTFDTSSEWFGFMLTFVILGMYAWLTMARIARGQMLEVRSKDYVVAARALGASPARIIFRHSIPNILGPVIIYATINIPAVILLEAFLSFLGLGISEPYCSWGTLANDGFKTLSYLGTNWWLIVFPGGIMAISLFALNFLGDGIRDAIDPRMR